VKLFSFPGRILSPAFNSTRFSPQNSFPAGPWLPSLNCPFSVQVDTPVFFMVILTVTVSPFFNSGTSCEIKAALFPVGLPPFSRSLCETLYVCTEFLSSSHSTRQARNSSALSWYCARSGLLPRRLFISCGSVFKSYMAFITVDFMVYGMISFQPSFTTI